MSDKSNKYDNVSGTSPVRVSNKYLLHIVDMAKEQDRSIRSLMDRAMQMLIEEKQQREQEK